MPAEFLLALVELLNGTTKLALAITASQTPAQQVILWDRYLKSTQWISDLLEKFSADIEKLISQGSANGPLPPTVQKTQ